MMFANAKHVETDLIGKRDLLDQVGKPLSSADEMSSRRVGRPLDEAVDAEFHRSAFTC